MTRGGLPVRNRAVQLIGTAEGYREACTDANGRWTFDVAAGVHNVAVPFAGVVLGNQQTSLMRHENFNFSGFAIRERVEVQKEQFVALQLPAGVITIRTLSAKSALPLAKVDIGLRWRGHELVTATDSAGMARYEDLDFRRHTLTISTRGYSLAHESAELDRQTPQAHLDVTLEPVGAFDLRLLGQDNEPVELSAAMQVAVTKLRDETPVTPTNMRELRQTPRPKVLHFDDLDPGRYRIELRDEICGERIRRHQPVDATAPLEVEIPAGQVTSIELNVLYRAYVRLRAHDQVGAMGDGQLAVERLDEQLGTLRILPAAWQHGARSGDAHFDGYLAPGTYVLTFTSGERQHRDSLVVARENVDRTLTLPW